MQPALRRRALAAAAGAAMASTTAALAQKTVDFQIKYDKPVLQPGEHQQITVWAEFAPGPGATVIYEPFNKVGTVVAFASTIFDLLTMLNGETGEFTQWELNPTLAIAKWHGVPDGFGNMIGMGPGQAGFILDTSNPILLWSATWKPANYTPRDVVFTTAVTSPAKIYIDLGGVVPLFEEWESLHLPQAFQVVPAVPSSVPILIISGLLLRSRRRACSAGETR